MLLSLFKKKKIIIIIVIIIIIIIIKKAPLFGSQFFPFKNGVSTSVRESFAMLKLRYDWPFDDIPSGCACGENFTVDNAMICKRGGFMI